MSKDIEDALRQHRSFDHFQDFEKKQKLQEDLRRQFKAPLGRDPPLRLTLPEPAWKSCRQLLSPQTTAHHAHKRSRDARLPFTKDAWEHAQAFKKKDTFRPIHLDPLPRLASRSVPTPTQSLSDSFQYATPASDSLSRFNPFLRPYAHNHFFPLTFFFMDETDYSQGGFPQQGWSRWRDTDEKWEWKPCTVLSYDPRERLFHIVWKDSEIEKKVSRVNIRFESESEEDFLRKLTEATQRRDLQEAIFRYGSRVESSLPQYPAIRLTADEESRILTALRPYLLFPSTEHTLLREITDYYRRSVVNFIFEIEYFFPKWQLTVL